MTSTETTNTTDTTSQLSIEAVNTKLGKVILSDHRMLDITGFIDEDGDETDDFEDAVGYFFESETEIYGAYFGEFNEPTYH